MAPDDLESGGGIRRLERVFVVRRGRNRIQSRRLLLFSHDNPTYQPEKITAYSVGSKNRFLDNRLQLNGELFYWIYKNQQISHVGVDSAGTVIFPTDNVGKAKMKGFELEAQYLLTATTLFTTDVDYLDAIYDSYIYLVPESRRAARIVLSLCVDRDRRKLFSQLQRTNPAAGAALVRQFRLAADHPCRQRIDCRHDQYAFPD